MAQGQGVETTDFLGFDHDRHPMSSGLVYLLVVVLGVLVLGTGASIAVDAFKQ